MDTDHAGGSDSDSAESLLRFYLRPADAMVEATTQTNVDDQPSDAAHNLDAQPSHTGDALDAQPSDAARNAASTLHLISIFYGNVCCPRPMFARASPPARAKQTCHP